MSRLAAVVVILVACMLGSAETRGQARGPSARQVQEEGQEIHSTMDLRRQEWERDWGEESRAREREEMRRDPALRAKRLAELDAFLRRLTGRFRIEGRIERVAVFMVETAAPINSPRYVTGQGKVSAKVTGIADCSSIGKGAGVNCLLSASWPPFDRKGALEIYCEGDIRKGCKRLYVGQTLAELFDTMRPAVLAFGLDTDPPQLRAMLVTADTLTNEWLGKLDGNNARLIQTQVCTVLRCYDELRINAEPDSEVVTFTLLFRLYGSFNIALTMHRAPDARLEEVLEPMQQALKPSGTR